jgi:hypothetical protein
VNARVRESLRVALSHLAPVVRDKLAAIFVAGSAADPNAKLGLDVDLFFLVDADCHQRQHLLLDASRVIDIFVYPLAYAVAQLTPRGNSLIVRALASSEAIWDPRAILPDLTSKASELLSGACEIAPEQRFMLQLRTRRLYLALADAAGGTPQVNYLFALLAHSVAAAHVVAGSRWSIGEKHAMLELAAYRPDVARSIDNLLDTARSTQDRLAEARNAINAMLGEDTLSATDLVGPLVGRDV